MELIRRNRRMAQQQEQELRNRKMVQRVLRNRRELVLEHSMAREPEHSMARELEHSKVRELVRSM